MTEAIPLVGDPTRVNLTIRTQNRVAETCRTSRCCDSTRSRDFCDNETAPQRPPVAPRLACKIAPIYLIPLNPARATDQVTVDNFRRDCLRELKKIKHSWPDLHYRMVKGALLLSPSPPAIAPSQLRLVE